MPTGWRSEYLYKTKVSHATANKVDADAERGKRDGKMHTWR